MVADVYTVEVQLLRQLSFRNYSRLFYYMFILQPLISTNYCVFILCFYFLFLINFIYYLLLLF